MKLFSLLLILLILSCQNKESKSLIFYPEGFFLIEKQLHFSDGERFYCGFVNWAHLHELRGSKEPPKQKIIRYKKPPSGMKFIKYCNAGIVTPAFFK